MNIRCHTKHENGRRSLALLGKHDQAHLEQHSDPPASAATAPRSMSSIGFSSSYCSSSSHQTSVIPTTNLPTLALYMSHSGNGFDCRCITVTAIRAADLGRNSVSKHLIQPEYEHEQADAGQDCRTRLAETKFSGANADREIILFSPIQLITSRIGNLTRLIHILAKCVTIHTYIHTCCARFVWSVLRCSVERSGANYLSRSPKIFVTAAISKSWAKTLPRGHISGHLEILEDFFVNNFTHKSET